MTAEKQTLQLNCLFCVFVSVLPALSVLYKCRCFHDIAYFFKFGSRGDTIFPFRLLSCSIAATETLHAGLI